MRAVRRVLVHNACINLPGWNRLTVAMAHIAARHMTGGSQIADRTVFTGMSERGVMAAIRQAYSNATNARGAGRPNTTLGDHEDWLAC